MRENDSGIPIDVLLEAVRYAELRRVDLGDDESGMMIRAVWQLLNPCGSDSRKGAVSRLVKKDDGSLMRFTAHSHDNEPLAESYDDILIYRRIGYAGTSSVHYIVDRFCPKKII